MVCSGPAGKIGRRVYNLKKQVLKIHCLSLPKDPPQCGGPLRGLANNFTSKRQHNVAFNQPASTAL
jgi:hypothetical protein